MPGIFGVIARDRSSQNDLGPQFERMARLLKHLDYYRIERVEGPGFVMGSIGIPHRGYRTVRQDESSGNAVAFHGFVYGWRGESPVTMPQATEPVAMIPLDDSEKIHRAPEHMNGSFVAAFYDKTADRFTMCTDRLGFRRLYYYQDDKVIAFAPEIKAFMALDSFRADVNLDGAADFFNYNFIIGARTLYKGVTLLQPASRLTVERRTLSGPEKYWRHSYNHEMDGDADAAAKEMYEIGRDVIHRQVGQHDHFAMALSGGMDSRLLAYYLKPLEIDVMHYTHGHARTDDARIAAIVADKLGVSEKFAQLDYDHKCYANFGAWTTWLVDGMVYLNVCDLTSILAQYREDPLQYEFLNSMWSGRVNFTLSYAHDYDITNSMTFEQKVDAVSTMMSLQFLNEPYYELFAPDFRQHIKVCCQTHIEDDMKKAIGAGEYFLHEKDVYYLEGRSLRLTHQYDINRFFYNSHHALIDDDIVAFRDSLPMKLQVDRQLYTKMFCDLIPEMAKIEYQKTGVDLYSQPDPNRAVWHRRMNRLKYLLGRISLGKINLYDYHTYLHQDIWYRKHRANRMFFEGILLDPRTEARGYFNMPAVRTLLKKQARGSSNYQVIASLATFELFLRYFIDREDPPPYRP